MGKNWAIAVGINDYYNLQPLHFAVQDAESVRDFFLSQPIQFEQVYTFSDHSPPIETPHGPMRSLPTYANLKRFLRKRFQQPFLEMGDNFWFFFAGHGELHEGHDYLMPIDADPGNVAETALRIGDITACLRNCGADNVILLLDACRSQGQRSGKGFGSEEQAGMVTIYSCNPREASYEIDDLQHGSFTYALLEGLHLQGIQNCATVERLDQYLRYQVPDLNQRYGKPPQTPYTAVEPVSKNHLILLPHQSTLLADVQALKVAAFEAESEQNFLLAEQLWIRVLAVSQADQQAIKAIKRLALLGIAEAPNGISQTTSPESANAVEDPEDPQIRAIRRQHELEVMKTQLEIQRIDADFFKAQQEYEFESRLIDARLQGFMSAMKGEQPQPERPQKSSSPIIQAFKFEIVTVDEEGRKINRQQGQAQCYVEDLGNGVQLEIVSIPGGTFQMGSPEHELDRLDREGPQQQVTIKPFWMGKYPVTQTQWRVVAGLPKINQDLKLEPSNFKGENRPVECVSWHEAIEFCDRLSRKTGREYRLPSEAEWEYACRAGTTTPFHFGETITADLANFLGDYTFAAAPQGKERLKTTEVGCFPPNAFGLYDMHGNLWEWCLDHWHDDYSGAPTDGSAWITGENSSSRLLRGGSWIDNLWECRSAFRDVFSPGQRDDFIGFRVVCSAPRTL